MLLFTIEICFCCHTGRPRDPHIFHASQQQTFSSSDVLFAPLTPQQDLHTSSISDSDIQAEVLFGPTDVHLHALRAPTSTLITEAHEVDISQVVVQKYQTHLDTMYFSNHPDATPEEEIPRIWSSPFMRQANGEIILHPSS